MIRKRMQFNDLYKYHIDKYNYLIDEAKKNVETSEASVKNIKGLLLRNAEEFSKYMNFDIVKHLEEDKPLATKSLCIHNKRKNVKRYAISKNINKANKESVATIVRIYRLLESLYNARIYSFDETAKISLYESYLLSKEDFENIYDKWELKVEELLLQGEDIKLPSGAGNIGFYRILNNYTETSKASRTIQWGETNKLKKLIIDNGGVLYNKHDHDRAKERNEEYNGVPYVVFKSDTFSYSFQHWDCKQRFINFNLTKTHGKEKVDELYNFIKEHNGNIPEIIDLNVNLQYKILLLLRLYPHYTVRFDKVVSHNKYLNEINNKHVKDKDIRELNRYRVDYD